MHLSADANQDHRRLELWAGSVSGARWVRVYGRLMAQISMVDFEAEARAFLDANATKKEAEKKFVWGEGADKVAMFEEKDRKTELEDVRKACEWRAKKYDAGFGWISGPATYGGRELPNAYERLWNGLEGQYQVPNQGAFTIGLGMVAPTILAHGSEEAKDAYLAKMYRGDIVGCQLFSEPGAGSDLASLQTKAERDGEEWVITGQKVWTTGAQYSDLGEIIARTDPDLPKHKGLTGFIVDMKAPGVEVRPLRQMTGGASFNEVFFNEMRVRDDHRLGDVNNGWNVALTTLMNERAAIGAGGGGGGGVNLYSRLVEMVKAFGLDNDPLVRNQLANLLIHHRVAGYNNQRAMDKIKAGQLPGPEMSIAKLAGTLNSLRMGDFVSKVLGVKLIADSGEWGTYSWNQLILGTPGGRIAGGSDEVMRNIVGERVLGLPKDAGIDSTSPFKDLKVGTQTSGRH
jgi:acyl-CoA dehydrogenase